MILSVNSADWLDEKLFCSEILPKVKLCEGKSRKMGLCWQPVERMRLIRLTYPYLIEPLSSVLVNVWPPPLGTEHWNWHLIWKWNYIMALRMVCSKCKLDLLNRLKSVWIWLNKGTKAVQTLIWKTPWFSACYRRYTPVTVEVCTLSPSQLMVNKSGVW